MDARPIPRLPELSVSSGSSSLIRLRGVAHIAGAAGVPAISLDLNSRLAQVVVARQSVPTIRVTAIWIGDPWASDWSGSTHGRHLVAFVQRLGAEAVAVDLGGAGGKIVNPTLLIRRVAQARQLLGRDCQLFAAIRGRQLLGGRQHLADLTALRHLAEEWDLGIALDLAGKLDPTWEAEAAVFRLGNYLKLMRVPTTATDRHPIGQARVISRAIAAAVDQGVPPEIALVPTVPFVQLASQRARSESVARAATAIANRVVSIKAQRAQFLDRGLWPNLRG